MFSRMKISSILLILMYTIVFPYEFWIIYAFVHYLKLRVLLGIFNFMKLCEDGFLWCLEMYLPRQKKETTLHLRSCCEKKTTCL